MNRDKKIIKTSILGIFVNILLVILKATIGLIANSIAIILDALNNLTDILSALITIIGTKLANRPADREHPYGHGRIEYIAALTISAIVLLAGIMAGKESIQKIITPNDTKYSLLFLILIAITVMIKYIFGKYAKRIGKEVNSHSLIATGQDAFMDSVLSFTTLIAAIINYVWGLNIEGYLGAIISIVIIRSAIEILKGTIDTMLGERVSSELANNLKTRILSFEEVQGAYDLNLHSYGPYKTVGSVHIQVRNDMTAEEIHILTRKIEYEIFNEFAIALTIGIYAANDKGEFGEIKTALEDIVREYPSVLQIHGFYVDKANSNVYFDLIIDFEEENKEKIKDEIVEKIKSKYSQYNYNVIMDSDITD